MARASTREGATFVFVHQSTLASALFHNTTPTPFLSFFFLIHPPASPAVSKMPGVAKKPAKRVLGDASSARQNMQASPRSAKKLKLDNGTATIGRVPVKIANGPPNASQPQKSRFEEEVLEQMSQDIESLKQTNAERDQHWQRPPLADNFNEMTHGIIMQQIDAEEGVLNGGKGTVKLFGVTEVAWPRNLPCHTANERCNRTATRYCSTSRTSSTTSTLLPRSASRRTTAMRSGPTSNQNARKPSTSIRRS
jgi:hypothetical protein